MKPHYKFLFVLAILLCINKSILAQDYGRAAAARNAMHMHNVKAAKPIRIHHNYTYNITLKDGRSVQLKGRIKPAKTPNDFVLVSSQQKKEIKPGETLQITRTDAQGLVLTGTANKGKWLFPVITGNINGYSTYAENDTRYVTHITKAGSTTLIPFNTRTKKERVQTAAALRGLIKGHLAAEELLDKHERKVKKKKIAKYTALGGLGLTGIAVVAASPVLVAGLPVAFIAGAVSVSVKPVDLIKVIEAYNQPVNQ